MRSPVTRRLSSVAGAFALALGGSAVAIAAGGPALPDQASDQAGAAVEAEQVEQAEDLELENDPEQQNDPEVQNEHAGENAEAFSTWVEGLPEDLGCVRGYMVSQAARGDHRGDDFVPPLTVEQATAALADHPCLGGGDEVELEGDEDERPEDAGPPSHAKRPAHAGVAGPPAHAGQGRAGR